MGIEDLDNAFKYNGKFDPSQIREMLGLDGHQPVKTFPEIEILRLANLLFRGGLLSDQDIKDLGMNIVKHGEGK